jgi:hypothetical protein
MKIFLIKITILSLLVLSTFLMIAVITPPDFSSYNAAIIDKHSKLENTPGPRIILVGGSNVAFGIDSEAIQNRFNMPVINMGLHAGQGLKFMLDDLKDNVKDNDIILVIPEYEQFYGCYGLYKGSPVLLDTLTVYPKGIRYLDDLSQIINVLDRTPKFLKDRWNRLTTQSPPSHGPIYSRDAFNQYGDVISHLDQAPQDITHLELLPKGYAMIEIDGKVIDLLNQFAINANKKNAKVYFVHPCIPEKQYLENINAISTFQEYLLQTSDFQILSTPTNYVYPQEYFFDTIYHLNSRGRLERTKRLIEDMETGIQP